MKTHQLKIWPQWFDAVRLGSKTFEVRKDDRNFQVGDEIVLEEFRPAVGEYTGRTLRRTITYVLRNDDEKGELAGLQPGYVVLGIRPI